MEMTHHQITPTDKIMTRIALFEKNAEALSHHADMMEKVSEAYSTEGSDEVAVSWRSLAGQCRAEAHWSQRRAEALKECLPTNSQQEG